MVAEVRLAEADAQMAGGVDLRRLRVREWAEELVARANHLPGPDRALIYAVYDTGLPISQIAAKNGHAARTLRRRVRALASRMASPEYRFVARQRRRWTQIRRAVGTTCFLNGKSQRDAAKELNISLYTVRKHHAAIVAQCEANGS